jgi:short-subunit dehydrogenase
LGVFIARALAGEGVNLVLTARNTALLEKQAEDIRRTGIKVISVTADLTEPDDRRKLIETAEAQLGPADILVNNAGIIQWIGYSKQGPEQIQKIIETNLVAPLMLSRLVLPGMIARRNGHIINNVSMAGKKGIPFEAAYAASKAGLLEWASAMRIELDQSGVGITSILPSIVHKVGMSADHGLPAPRLAGAVDPEPVARAVIRAIRTNPQEIIVRSQPTRPLLALTELWPELGDFFLKIMGVISLQRHLADEE